MLYFILPKTHPNIQSNITCIALNERNPDTYVSQSLFYYLSSIKEKIKDKEEWDTYKKYTNPYEYIHTIVPQKKKSVAKYKPLSRAYFKMIELFEYFHLNKSDTHIRSFHLAEGPGGFIEALANIRKCEEDNYIGMTLLDDNNDENIPAWKKTDNFLRDHPNVFIENGVDGTGNILSLSNLDYCRDKYGGSMDIITADGGFDFSVDFNNQETNMSRLLFAQVCFAIIMQKQNGCFILKIFDCFTEATMDILYILSSFYKKVYITKPKTSRYANSEKYVVCKDFDGECSDAVFHTLRNAFENMVESPQNNTITRFLSCPISYYFYKKIEDYNAIFGQQQIENINITLDLINNKKNIENIVKIHIQRCIQWCNKHSVQYNFIFSTPSDIEQSYV
jgi:23S rRNA U2552 (ribose-2'-O)-methylase RlmE/FtsJ